MLKIENSDRRCILWQDDADSPEILGLRDLDLILNSDGWFGRKFDMLISPEVLDRLDDVIGSKYKG
jgi:hypothetical protein